jgi:hypothetical protein
MTNDLTHFGVLGMHWGVRRNRTDTSSPDHTLVKSIRTKKLNEMSNDELKKLTTRLNLEKQYKDLTKNDVSLGSKIAGQLLGVIGNAIANQFTSFATKQINQVFQDMMDKQKGK